MSLFSWFKRKPDPTFFAEVECPASAIEIDKIQEVIKNQTKPRIGAAAQILSSYILKNYSRVQRISHYHVDEWSETAIYDILGHQWRFDWYSERAIKYYENGAAPTGFREYLAGQNNQGLFTPEESAYIKNACIEAIARQERDEIEFQRKELLRLGDEQ